MVQTGRAFPAFEETRLLPTTEALPLAIVDSLFASWTLPAFYQVGGFNHGRLEKPHWVSRKKSGRR